MLELDKKLFQFNSLFGRSVPCFHPLVWTIDDGNGMNGPILAEIEQQCEVTNQCCNKDSLKFYMEGSKMDLLLVRNLYQSSTLLGLDPVSSSPPQTWPFCHVN